MKVEDMRQAVIAAYSGPSWRLKVQVMPDRQVIAIFRSMVEEGRLSPKGKVIKKPHQPTTEKPKKPEPYCEQMTIWDLFKEER